MGLHNQAGGALKGVKEDLHPKGMRSQVSKEWLDSLATKINGDKTPLPPKRIMAINLAFRDTSQLESLLLEILNEVKANSVVYRRYCPLGEVAFGMAIDGVSEAQFEAAVKSATQDRGEAEANRTSQGEIQGGGSSSTDSHADKKGNGKSRSRRKR